MPALKPTSRQRAGLRTNEPPDRHDRYVTTCHGAVIKRTAGPQTPWAPSLVVRGTDGSCWPDGVDRNRRWNGEVTIGHEAKSTRRESGDPFHPGSSNSPCANRAAERLGSIRAQFAQAAIVRWSPSGLGGTMISVKAGPNPVASTSTLKNFSKRRAGLHQTVRLSHAIG